jgi:hypothetical protein
MIMHHPGEAEASLFFAPFFSDSTSSINGIGMK